MSDHDSMPSMVMKMGMDMDMDMDMDMNNKSNNYMHTSFYWGSKAIILFPNWSDRSLVLYLLALLLVFVAATVIELFHVADNYGNNNNTNSSKVPTVSIGVTYGLRVALSYVVMLSVMSFNVGVFVAAVAGHVTGFLVVRVRRSNRFDPNQDKDPTSLVY